MSMQGRLPTSRALLYGTLAVGVLDLLDAFVFFGLRSGVRPIRILHSIASGLLGRASFAGGWRTGDARPCAALLHRFVIVLVFMMASRPLPWLRRHAVPAGCSTARRVSDHDVRRGAGISAASGAPPWPVALNGVLIHMFGVGVPAALAGEICQVVLSQTQDS
jgi:hypothetical protein